MADIVYPNVTAPQVLDFTPVAGAPLIDGAHQAGSMAMNANPAVQVNIGTKKWKKEKGRVGVPSVHFK